MVIRVFWTAATNIIGEPEQLSAVEAPREILAQGVWQLPSTL
jgi:hypothetical protein